MGAATRPPVVRSSGSPPRLPELRGTPSKEVDEQLEKLVSQPKTAGSKAAEGSTLLGPITFSLVAPATSAEMIVEHKLGKTLTEWVVVRQIGFGDVCESRPPDDAKLYLQASASMTIYVRVL